MKTNLVYGIVQLRLIDIHKEGVFILKKREKNTLTDKKIELRLRIIEVISGVVSGVIALVAVILSIITLRQSKEIINYQVMQESMPQLVVLNNNMNINFEVDNYKIYNYDSANSMCISVYNVGMGIAQNCKFTWDENSVISAVEEGKKQLSNCVACRDYDSKKEKLPSLIIYDYIFEYEKNELESITFYDPSLSESKSIDFKFKSIDTPYILPVSKEDGEVLIEIPKPISIMLLEYANQNIDNSISIDFEIKYEDIMGQPHNETFSIEFSVKKVSDVEMDKLTDKNNLMCEYDIVVNRL